MTLVESSTRKSWRQWLQENHALGVSGALLMIAASIAYIFFYAKPREMGTFDFVDEETGKPSVHSADQVPPLIGASGKPTVVRAIFAGRPGADDRTLLYLEKYSDEAKAYMDEYHRSNAKGPPNVPHPKTAVWVRLPKDGSPWVPRDSDAGQAIVLNMRR